MEQPLDNQPVPESVVPETPPMQAVALEVPPHQPPRRSKLSVRLLITLVTIFVGVVIVVAVYWFAIRVPNAVYGEADVTLEKMINTATDLKKQGEKQGKTPLANLSEQQKSDFYKQAKSYQTSLEKLQKNRAITNDAIVQKAYESHRKAIEEYATSTIKLTETTIIVAEILNVCNEEMTTANTASTVSEFEDATAGCTDRLARHRTVAISDFNEGYYVPYRTAMLKLLKSGRAVLLAYEAGDEDTYMVAGNRFTAAYDELKEVGHGKDFHLSNSKNPADDLKSIQMVIRTQRPKIIR